MKKFISLLLLLPLFVKAQYVPVPHPYLGEPKSDFTGTPINGAHLRTYGDTCFAYRNNDGTLAAFYFKNNVLRKMTFEAPPTDINAIILLLEASDLSYYGTSADIQGNVFKTEHSLDHPGWYFLKIYKYSSPAAKQYFNFGKTEKEILSTAFKPYKIDSTYTNGYNTLDSIGLDASEQCCVTRTIHINGYYTLHFYYHYKNPDGTDDTGDHVTDYQFDKNRICVSTMVIRNLDSTALKGLEQGFEQMFNISHSKVDGTDVLTLYETTPPNMEWGVIKISNGNIFIKDEGSYYANKLHDR